MGVELVKAVSVRHGQLPGNAFKVLVRMAVVALDRPGADGRPAGLYFGGWEQLGLAMGWDVPDRSDDPETTRRRRKVKNYVTSALKVLHDEQLIERLEDKARTGTRQVYKLMVTTGGTQKVGPTWDPESGVQWTPESGAHVGPKNRVTWDPGSGAPRKDVTGTEDLFQDSTTPSPLTPHGDARRAAGKTSDPVDELGMWGAGHSASCSDHNSSDGLPDRAADVDARFLAAQAARADIAAAQKAAQR